jgi:GMP synthase-like glutamine amidotransferase
MKFLIVDNIEAQHEKEFNFPLIYNVSRVSEYEIAHYTEVDEDYINSARNLGGVILSGVPTFYPVDVIDERASRLEFLKRSPVPLLGICLGHQSLGRAFGAEIIEGAEHETGNIQVLIKPDHLDNPLFEYLEKPAFEAQAMHTCSITLPKDFIPLATSETCANQVMKHEHQPLYGVQFHPERSLIGETLLRNFANIAQTHHQILTKP